MIRHRDNDTDYVSFGLKEWLGLAIAALSPCLTMLGIGISFYGEFSSMKTDLANIKAQVQTLTTSERTTVTHEQQIANITERLRALESKGH